jgi:tetratricopeptide (TPR) repeat protein
MKKVLFLVLILVFSLNVFAQNTQTQTFDLTQYGVRIEPDKRLIVVLASLEAAGLETPLTEKGSEFRKKLRADLKGLDEKLVEKLKFFVKQYKARHPNATDAELISPFISMAYTLSPVPDLTEPSRTSDLPGDLLDVLDYSPLVREFYRSSALRTKLDEYVKDYQNAGDSLRKSTELMVRQLLDYMHTRPQLTYVERIKVEAKSANNKKTIEKTEVRERERRFYIVPELLVSRGTINFINIGDDYYAILPTETNLSSSEVRNAYLQFVLDPLVLNNAKEIATLRDGIKVLLDERRKNNPNVSPDIFLAVLRSMVAAVDAKQTEVEKVRLATSQARQKIDLMKTPDEKKAVAAELAAFKQAFADDTALQLSEAYERGAVLAFYFADQLKGFEESDFDIASSMRDIILSIDTTKETNRLPQFADARKRAAERKKNVAVQPKVIENPVTVRLLAIDKITTDKNYTEAESSLKKLLAEYPTESARINYALGRVLSLSAEGLPKEDIETRNRRLLEAKVSYTNVLLTATTETDPALLSLTYVALARIYEFFDETEFAVKIYETAIKIGDVTGGAYKEAVEARERLLKK